MAHPDIAAEDDAFALEDFDAVCTAVLEQLRATCHVPWAQLRLGNGRSYEQGWLEPASCREACEARVQRIFEQGQPMQTAWPQPAENEATTSPPAPGLFAGRPIHDRRGRLLAVLSVGGPEAGALTAGQTGHLELAARHLGTELELLRLQEQPRQFQVLIDGMPAIFYVTDEAGRLLRWNQHLLEVTGRDANDLPGLDVAELFAREHRPQIASLHARAMATGHAQGELRVRGSDAFSRPYLLTCQYLQLGGQPRIVGMGLDISPLTETEARYRSLAQSARDAIVVLRPDGGIESVDGAFQEITGWEPAAWLGRNLAELIHPPDLPRAVQALADLPREERMPLFEIRVQSASGTPVPLEIQGTQVPLDANTVGALVIARDIRDRKAMDLRLQRMQRLDAVSQLAAGIAHDFNNLLQVIHGEVDLLLTHPLLTPSVKEALQNVEEASSRAQRLARKLLLLGRQPEWQPESLDLNALIARFLPMLQRLLGPSHDLHWQPEPDLPPMQGDLGMLEQVLMNLVINARDAMPDGGVVTLATSSLDVGRDRAARYPDAQPGRYLELLVADSGVGIETEHLSQIFEPLFTTKAMGAGTGLGLATVYGIVRRHQGWLDVESRPGEGARFLLYFPTS